MNFSKDMISDADYIIIGIGEAVEKQFIKEDKEIFERMVKEDEDWLYPVLMDLSYENINQRFVGKINEITDGKKAYIITDSVFDFEKLFKADIVEPMGSVKNLQCSKDCTIKKTDEDFLNRARTYVNEKYILKKNAKEFSPEVCPICGKAFRFSSVYTADYNEENYRANWVKYNKFIEGTLNRKLLLMELGEGFRCPTIFRNPFEKIAYFNKKAVLIRVNESLYQIPDDIADKAVSVKDNPIDWLCNL